MAGGCERSQKPNGQFCISFPQKASPLMVMLQVSITVSSSLCEPQFPLWATGKNTGLKGTPSTQPHLASLTVAWGFLIWVWKSQSVVCVAVETLGS